MPVSEKKKASNQKWDKENMTIIGCKVRKEEAERIKQYAADHGTNVNALLLGYLRGLLGTGRTDPADDPTE